MKRNMIRYSGDNEIFENVHKTDVRLISITRKKVIHYKDGVKKFSKYVVSLKYTFDNRVRKFYFETVGCVKKFVGGISKHLLCSIDFRVKTTVVRIHKSESGKVIIEYRNNCERDNTLLRNSTGVFTHTSILEEDGDIYLGLNTRFKKKEQLALFGESDI